MIVFLSNFYNHHQAPFSEAMDRLTQGQYRFIATGKISTERKALGWGGETGAFVLQYADDPVQCQQLIDMADVVIFGSAPYEMLKTRLRQKKLTIAYSERIYKKPCPAWQIPLRAVKYFFKYGRYKNLYLLCASAYTAPDYAKTGTFLGKTYKWGYFPETKRYENVGALIEQKKPNSILWVARLISLKHPELPIQVAKRLKAEGYEFRINMIGNGELEKHLRKLIQANGLEDCVHLLGTMKPQEVREHMERSQVFLFTSDRNEGWGAVLNESMNSGCAVVASHAIGAVPFLIEQEKNGLIYEDGNFEALYAAVKTLLDDPELAREYGRNAYQTIVDQWNAETAAERLLILTKELEMGKKSKTYQEGPCSKAEILEDGWFHK